MTIGRLVSVCGAMGVSTTASTTSYWIGEEWRASDAWQWQGGLRFDVGHPRTKPAYNPAVEQLFSVRTDRIPDDVGISPRIGFSWTSEARRGRRTRGGASTLGGLSAREIAAMPRDLVTSFSWARVATRDRVLAWQNGALMPGALV